MTVSGQVREPQICDICREGVMAGGWGRGAGLTEAGVGRAARRMVIGRPA